MPFITCGMPVLPEISGKSSSIFKNIQMPVFTVPDRQNLFKIFTHFMQPFFIVMRYI